MMRIESEYSDELLLERFRQGDEEGFTLLFRRYSRRIFGYVHGILGDADLADDVVQKVFVKLARRPEAFTPGGSFASWLHAVARNAALDAIKGRRNPMPVEDLDTATSGAEPAPVTPDDPNPPQIGIRNQDINLLVHRAVQKLGGPQREALVLREYSELSYREISRITGRSLTNVKQDIYQARQFLRTELAPHLGRITQG